MHRWEEAAATSYRVLRVWLFVNAQRDQQFVALNRDLAQLTGTSPCSDRPPPTN